MTPLAKPHSSPELEQAVVEVLRSGWWGYGPKTKELEEEFAKYVHKKYAVAVNSGTSALDLCLKVYNVKGGELITTPMTFVSDAIVGEWNGMDVTFGDIEEDSLCLDPVKLHITKDTKAIIAVDSHGRLANIKGIRNRFDGLVIEDCAHAMYTPNAGKHSDIQIWSFQAVKTCPAGDGGMITTDDEDVYNKLRSLTWLNVKKTFDRVQGDKYVWDYDIDSADGIKAYMNDLTAVIVLEQMKKLEVTNAKRRAIQSVYNEAFSSTENVKTPMYSHTVQYYTMRAQNRDELIQHLAGNGYHTSVHFKPLNHMTYWKKAQKRPLSVTDRVWPELISLPVFYDLPWSDVENIIFLVRGFYEPEILAGRTDIHRQ